MPAATAVKGALRGPRAIAQPDRGSGGDKEHSFGEKRAEVEETLLFLVGPVKYHAGLKWPLLPPIVQAGCDQRQNNNRNGDGDTLSQ